MVGAAPERTLAEKVWDAHVVRSAEGEPNLLYIDLQLVHEVIGGPAHLLGFSDGGEVALLMAIQDPQIARSVATCPEKAWSQV